MKTIEPERFWITFIELVTLPYILVKTNSLDDEALFKSMLFVCIKKRQQVHFRILMYPLLNLLFGKRINEYIKKDSAKYQLELK